MLATSTPTPHSAPQQGAICARCGRLLDSSVARCPFDGSETIQCTGAFEPGVALAGRYLLGEMIGHGGWGIVFRARDLRDGSDVAVKVLSPQHSRDPASVTRFLREQRTIARLHHPHVVSQRDHGHTDNGLFIVMELLLGRTLGLEIRRHAPLPPARAAGIAAQICEALYATHSRGVIHRDLKPDNVFLTEGPSGGDYAKVMDFGIAKLLGDDSGSDSPALIYGTPFYVSPEQAGAEHIDGRSDLYSTGVVLFEMLTGQLPFPREAAMLTMQRRIDQPAPDLRRFPALGIPDGLCDVVRSLLARDPAGRPRNAAEARELLAAFDDMSTPRPSRASPPPTDTPMSARLHDRFAALDYSPPMVGRDEEREQTARFANRLGTFDRGQVMLLSGPAGIGKSQIAHALVTLARGRGARAVEVECASGNAPLREIAGVIEAQLETARLGPEQARAVIRQRFADAGLGPEKMADDLLHLLRGDLDPSREHDGAGHRDYLLHLALSMLAHLAQAEPLVLVLEDAHRADPLTAALLAHAPLWFRSAGQGLLLVGVWTTGEGGEELPTEWRRIAKRFSERVALLELGPLDENCMDDLLRAIGPIDDAARRYVARLAQGNPLHALQIVRHLKNERLLMHGYRGWQLAPGAHLERPVPPAMDDFARFRVERLRRRRGAGERAADLLERASLCGDRIAIALLRRVLEHEGRGHLVDVLPELLDTLAVGAFIRPGAWTDDAEVVFDHPLARQAIAKGFEDRADTRPVHLAIAEALLTLASASARHRAIAAHLFAAGVPDRAFPFALESAAAARAVADLTLAGEDYRLALRCLTATKDPPQASAIEAHLGLGDVLLLQGHPQDAESEFRKVLDLEDLPEAWLALGKVAETTGATVLAMEFLPRAADLFGRAGRPAERAQALLVLGKVRVWRGDFDAARRDYEEALALLASGSDRAAVARARIALGNLYKWTSQPDRSLEILAEAARDAEQIGDPILLGECLYQIGSAHAERDDLAEAATALNRARELFSRTGHMRGQRACWASLGTVFAERGSLVESQESLETALRLAEDMDNQIAVASHMGALGLTSNLAGRFDDAVAWTTRSMGLAAEVGAEAILPIARCNLAVARLGLGDLAEAESLFLEILADPGIEHRREVEGECLEGLGDIARKKGDAPRARAWYTRARDVLRDARRPRYERAVNRKLEGLGAGAAESEQP